MNILILSNVYPSDDTKEVHTKVVHYFARKLANQHTVHAVLNNTIYPSILYKIGSLIRMWFSSRAGLIIPIKAIKNDRSFDLEGVRVHRLSIKKKIPHSPFADSAIKKQINKILECLKHEKFTPDLIISHWINPQLPIMLSLKETYHCKTCLIIHADSKNLRKIYREKAQETLSNIDVIGYRSLNIQDTFEKMYGKQSKTFIAYSGIADNVFSKKIERNFTEKLRKFLFVGLLVKRKSPESVIKAVSSSYQQENYELKYVGHGGELANLKQITKSLNAEEKVHFVGQVPHDEVVKYMQEAECFIMISRNETFGLVYLEAMGAGCITIASTDGGMRGIIKDGVNGFLCNPGDSENLKSIIEKINKLSPEERLSISNNARKTAEEFTEKKVADYYINNIISNL